jgi:hypothetical protein
MSKTGLRVGDEGNLQTIKDKPIIDIFLRCRYIEVFLVFSDIWLVDLMSWYTPSPEFDCVP